MAASDKFILIAEDDADDQAFITDPLQRSRFAGVVECVSDGLKLLQELKHRASTELPSIIVLDLNMPFKNGFDALTEIKQIPAFKNIPALVVTSGSNPEDELKCYSPGAAAYFRKPVSIVDYDHVAMNIIDLMSALPRNNALMVKRAAAGQ